MNSRLPLITLVLCVTFGLGACNRGRTSIGTPKEPSVLTIGEVGSMTGAEATFGSVTHMGISLAIDEANARDPAFSRRKLKLVTLDDQGKPEEAATAIARLITEDQVLAILGEVASSRSLAMAPIAQSQHVPMISPSSTHPQVTEQGDFIFRACFIDPFQGNAMARFAREKLRLSRVAIFSDVKNDYSVGLAESFTRSFKALGGEVVAAQSYSAGDLDFKAQLIGMNARSPEAIYIPGYYTEIGLIARQARELRIKVPLLGGDGWSSPKLFEIGGPALEGSYFSDHYSSEDASNRVQGFLSAFERRYGMKPDSNAASGYDAARLLIDAIKRVPGPLTGESLRDALARTQDFEALTGKLKMDAHRNPLKPAVILKVEKGRFRYQTTIAPG